MQDEQFKMYVVTTKRHPTQGHKPDQTPMSVSPDWKADGSGFRDASDIILPEEE